MALAAATVFSGRFLWIYLSPVPPVSGIMECLSLGSPWSPSVGVDVPRSALALPAPALVLHGRVSSGNPWG